MNQKITVIFLLLCSISFQVKANKIYVDSAHIGGVQNGSSWATAFSGFQAAIDDAGSGDSIWVGKGTYSPPLAGSFTMKEGVKIFGGFLNTHTTFAQRSWQTHTTRLKGTGGRIISNNGNGLTNAARLDGFTIVDGGNNGNSSGGMYNFQSSPIIINCTFLNNIGAYGAGMFNRQSNPVVNNCVFSGNRASVSGSSDCNGGAIYNTQSSPIISNCTFSNNVAVGYYITNYGNGGVLYNIDNSSPVISNCTFSGNTSGGGGGVMYNQNGSPSFSNCTFNTNNNGAIHNQGASTLTLVQCTFSGNTDAALVNGATCTISNCFFTGNSNIFGGAISSSGSMSISNSRFVSNTSGSVEGGAINILGGSVTMDSCVFSGNTGGLGGGVYCQYTNAIIKNSYFRGNTSGWGGGLYNKSSTVSVINCLFSGNSAAHGGGICNSESTAKIINCTITGNKTPFDNNNNANGGGVYYQSSTGFVTNTIIWGNQSGLAIDAFSSAGVSHSLIQGMTPQPANYVISSDPLFVNGPNFFNAPFTTGDYRLQATSPCINKGNNDSIPAGTNMDIADNIRISADTVDMGAYERIGIPLANERLYFSGTVQGNGSILLQWQMESVEPPAFYELQRSADGKDFSALTTLPATGPDVYSFTDQQPAIANFYRLRMIDADGAAVFSRVIQIRFKTGAAGCRVYPNPAKESIRFMVEDLSLLQSKMLLLDMYGRTLQEITITGNSMQVPLTGLPAGTYFLKMTDGTVSRFVKE